MIEKIEKIKLIVTDVDGVMTNGGITYHSDGTESKTFNVKDGQIVKHLIKQGYLLGVITGRTSSLVQRRFEELNFDFIVQGADKKLDVLNSKLKEFGLSLNQVCYIGDDINDLAVLKKVGFSACPSDAVDMVREEVDYISNKPGGHGVFRDVAEKILRIL